MSLSVCEVFVYRKKQGYARNANLVLRHWGCRGFSSRGMGFIPFPRSTQEASSTYPTSWSPSCFPSLSSCILPATSRGRMASKGIPYFGRLHLEHQLRLGCRQVLCTDDVPRKGADKKRARARLHRDYWIIYRGYIGDNWG